MLRARRNRLPALVIWIATFVLGTSSGSDLRADILLSDIVVGGDGSGTAPPENTGISADDGTFRQDYISAPFTNTGDNPQVVAA